MIGGAKYLRDAIAKLLGIDDSELGVRWHYCQAEVRTKAEEGTLVRVVDRKMQNVGHRLQPESEAKGC